MRKIFTGCGVISVIGVVLIGIVVVFAVVGSGDGTDTGSSGGVAEGESNGGGDENAQQEGGPGSSKDNPVPVGQTGEIGEVTWTITNAEFTDQVSNDLGSVQGDFIVVDLTFTNNSNEAVTLDSGSLTVIDEQDRESEASIDASTYIPTELDIFLDEVNPGVTQEARVAFEVAPDTSNPVLQANDAGLMSENYVYLALGI